MIRAALLATILLLPTTHALGDDTPFLKYACIFDKASGEHEFDISFKNDDSAETETWSSFMKSTKIRFMKTSRQAVKVWIHTGAPLVAYAVPGEFEFTAPLATDEIRFSFAVKPVGLKADFFELLCTKKKN